MLSERIFLFFCLTILLFSFVSCEKTSSSQGLNNRTNQPIEKTSLAVDAEAEIYYENNFRFQMVEPDSPKGIVMYDSTRTEDRLYMLYFIPGGKSLTAAEYTLDGQLVRTQTVHENVGGNAFEILDSETVLVECIKNGNITLAEYACDGTLLRESVVIDGAIPVVSSYQKIFRLGEDMICLTNGYDLYIFSDWQTQPVCMELPLLAERIERFSDHELIAWGRYGTYTNNIREKFHCIIHLDTMTAEEFYVSEEIGEPKNLFDHADYAMYVNGSFYGVCRDGLYVSEQENPKLLCSWEESYLVGESVIMTEVLSEDVFLIQYNNMLNMESREGFLMRVTEQRTKPREIVTAASIGLPAQAQKLISAAVSEFNQSSYDYRIYYKNYNDIDFDTTGIPFSKINEEREKAVQDSFKADLISGIIYDCYFMPDDSPNRKMLEDKNLFADLTPYIAEENLFSCAYNAYRSGSSISAVPITMILDTLVTSQNILPSTTVLDWQKLYDMAEELGAGEALFPANPYDNLIIAGFDRFADHENRTCSFDGEDFARYADFVSEIGNGKYSDLALSVVHEYTHADNHYFAVGEMNARDHITKKQVKFYPFRLANTESVAAMLYTFSRENINYCGYPSVDGAAAILSSDCVFSMTAAAECREGVKALLTFLTGKYVQNSTLAAHCGLPVTPEAVDRIFPLGYYHIMVMDYIAADLELQKIYPDAMRIMVESITDKPLDTDEKNEHYIMASVHVTEEDRDRFVRFLNRIKAITPDDGVSLEIMREELSYVSAGVRSGAEAGKILQSRIYMYLNE